MEKRRENMMQTMPVFISLMDLAAGDLATG